MGIDHRHHHRYEDTTPGSREVRGRWCRADRPRDPLPTLGNCDGGTDGGDGDDGDDDNDGDERERECIFQVKAISIIVCYLYPTCGATWSILIFFL